jgi:hypothetical protein
VAHWLAFQPWLAIVSGIAAARLAPRRPFHLHRPSSPPFADFNSHPRARIYVFNGGNRFIPLAFLPPSIPGYR